MDSASPSAFYELLSKFPLVTLPFIRDFEFGPSTPMYDWRYPFSGVVIYLVSIFALHSLMKMFPKWNPNPTIMRRLTELHNLILCVGSLFMFLGGLTSALRISSVEGLVNGIVCRSPEEDKSWTQSPLLHGPLAFWCYIYYMSKYYELLDTVILVLKRKPLTFLQMWHHSSIVVLSWCWIYGQWTIHVYAVVINTGIHVWMYYYFWASSAFGYQPWWKRYITTVQLIQFLSVFFSIWYFCSLYIQSTPQFVWGPQPTSSGPTTSTGYAWLDFVLSHYLPTLVFEKGCSGLPWVVFNSQAVNISFLILFFNFYVQTYILKKPRGPSKQQAPKDKKKN